MRRTDVEALPWREMASSNVRRVAFLEHGLDDQGQRVGELFVEFRAGRVYRYPGVRANAYRGLEAANAAPDESVGSRFHRTIRSVHAAEHITIEEDDERAERPAASG